MKTSLYEHQRRGVEFLNSKGYNGALFMDIGTGKTLTALSAFAERRKQDPHIKLLVICPISLIHAAWGEEIKKSSDFSYQSLREKKIQPADIYIINFESVITERMASVITDLASRNRLMVVIDESQRLKNHKSMIAKTLLRMAALFQHRIIMSGCPAPNGYSEYWAQMRFVDPTIFHKSPYVFLAEYFHLSRGNQTIDAVPKNKFAMREVFSKGFKYTITEEKKKSLLEKITPHCFFANIDDCLDLPPVTNMVRHAHMTPALAKVYKELEKQLVTEINGVDIAAPVALTKLMKLRELVGGFIITPDGQTLTVDCPKIDILSEILEDAGDQQVIIWHNFTWESKRIAKEFGIERFAFLNGEIKDKEAEIKAFQNGDRQYLLAHPKSGGAGLTFVNACLMIDYSLNYSFDDNIQTQGRFRRPGQKSSHLTRIRIVMQDSIDEIILGALEGKYEENQIVREFLTRAKK